MEDWKRKLVIQRLQNSVVTRFKAINPSFPLTSAHCSIIQQNLDNMFHSFHTPTHPPYSLMITRAIQELNEKNGSTEEDISKLIRREYKDLPWAHATILNLHLRRLCTSEDLKLTDNGRYVLLADCDTAKKDTKYSKRKRTNSFRTN